MSGQGGENDIPALSVRGLYAGYGKQGVLSGVDLTVMPCQVFGLIGPNGAGKTTLLRSILDLLPARGEVRLFGLPNHDIASRRQLIYLPERFQPAPQLLGREYLELQMRFYGKAFDIKAARTVAEELDLDPNVLSRRIGSYSKGMGQKLGLVSVFLVDLPLLMLDEPMSGLDPLARVRLIEKLLAYNRSGGTIFLNSHILADIERLCDGIALINNGRFLFEGRPERLIMKHDVVSLEEAFLATIAESDAENAA